MTNEEIQKHIEQNCRHEDGSHAMDEQAFYEGAKWMRDKALSLHIVSKRSTPWFLIGFIVGLLTMTIVIMGAI